jgi:CubicO group peptidase (beta-lactamase class C family)
MNNTWFNIPEKDAARVANIYRKTPNGLERGGPLAIGTQVYFSVAGGLTCTAEDYLQFAQMLANGGQTERQTHPEPMDRRYHVE